MMPWVNLHSEEMWLTSTWRIVLWKCLWLRKLWSFALQWLIAGRFLAGRVLLSALYNNCVYLLVIFIDSNFCIKGNEHYKTVFAVFFQGEQLQHRIKKVCAGFHASLYPCPHTVKERNDMLQGVKTRLEDLNLVNNMLFYFSKSWHKKFLNSLGFKSN